MKYNQFGTKSAIPVVIGDEQIQVIDKYVKQLQEIADPRPLIRMEINRCIDFLINHQNKVA